MIKAKPFNQYSWWIILNPQAGNGRAAQSREAIEELLIKQGFTYYLVETTHKKQAYDLVKIGVEKGYRHIMAIGGDGTNNEVVNGILRQNLIPATQLSYTILPLGTGNDWIKQHKIPANWK